MPKCQVGVVGTGVMATGTATLLICNRYPAVLYGRTQESCERGLRSVRAALDDLIAAGVLQEAQRDKALTYLSATTAYEDLAGCQFVIESAAETIDTKREVMAHLEAVCAPEAILSSTTSAISANEIAAEMKHPERFLVAHSWNPPHLVPLVEIVRCPGGHRPAGIDLLSGFLCHPESGTAAQARSGELPDRPEARRRSRPPGTGHRGQHSRLSGSAPGRDVQRRLFERRKKHAGAGGYGCHHRPDGGAFIAFIKLDLDFHAAGWLLPARFFYPFSDFPVNA